MAIADHFGKQKEAEALLKAEFEKLEPLYFSGTKGLLRDIINAVDTSRRAGKWTLYSKILGDWKIE